MDQASPTANLSAMTNNSSDSWTDEDAKEAVELFNAGHSMGSIADHFKDRTRSSVAGKIHRLRKQATTHIGPKRVGGRYPSIGDKRASGMGKPRATITRSKLPPPEKKPRVRLRLVDQQTEVTMQELEPHHCRWPIGDPRQSDFRFCGKSRVSLDNKTPYCSAHTAKASRKGGYEK